MEIEVRRTKDRGDEETSLSIYNEVWPHNAFSIDEVDSYKRSMRAYADHLAWLGGAAIGSAFVALEPARPNVGFASITVRTRSRGRGAGTALYREVSAWCSANHVHAIETPVEGEDEASLEFARRRGFAEIERYGRMVLDLAEIDAPEVRPPDRVHVVSWAERPELAHGIYEVALEAYPDMPGHEGDEMEPFEAWLAHDMQGSGDKPEATFLALAGDEVVGFAKLAVTAGPAQHGIP